MSSKLFKVEIIQPKFDELYRLYEGGFKKNEEKKTATQSSGISTAGWEKLKVFRTRIASTTLFDNNFKQLVGVELFDFIQENDTFKREFDRRLNYLKNLASDTSFQKLQDDLFAVIQKILKLISLQEIERIQKEWGNKLINKLKTRTRANGEKTDLTLPELYLALQDKGNYYKLGENSYYSPTEGEISIITHIIPVMNQYEMAESFFRKVFVNNFIDDKDGQAQVDKLLNEYNEYWYKLDEVIRRVPIRLHTQSFERFFLDCMAFHPRKGWEAHYDLFSQGSQQNNIIARQLKEAKDTSLVVIDDLIETCKVETGDKKTTISHIYSGAKTKALKNMKDEASKVSYEDVEKIVEKKFNEKTIIPIKNATMPDKLTVSLKDREIRVNHYLIGKPHATGKNMTFFEYVFENPDKPLQKENMPEGVKREITGKSITKILNALGFSGEILKAFFPKRGKNECLFKKQITCKEFADRGINWEILMQELNLAHSKNSPK